MRGYCWRAGYTVVLGGKCPECGDIHDPIPDQSRCGNFSRVTESWGMPCVLDYGHEGDCTHLEERRKI